MNERLTESRKAIASAQEALKKGAMSDAREWAERAAKLTPQNEEAWLILAAIVSPRESLEYLRKALEINPKSPRAKKGLEWAAQRLDEKPKAATKPQNDHSTQEKTRRAAVKKTKQKRVLLLSILLILMGCAVFAFAAWSAITSPALASILRTSATPQAQTQPPFAQVNIAKPAAVMFTAQPPAAATLLPAPILPTLELTVEHAAACTHFANPGTHGRTSACPAASDRNCSCSGRSDQCARRNLCRNYCRHPCAAI